MIMIDKRREHYKPFAQRPLWCTFFIYFPFGSFLYRVAQDRIKWNHLVKETLESKHTFYDGDDW